MGISLLFDGVVLFYIYMFKGLQAHPMKIFMWLSISNFCFMWPTLLMTFTCDLHLEDIFGHTVLWIVDSSASSIETIMITVPFQITFWYNMVLMLNIMLCLDLILTFRSPFKKPESRYWIYLTVSVGTSLIPGFLRSKLLAKYHSQYLYGWFIVYTFGMYLAIAIVSIYYAFKHLNKPGMSSESRILLTRRHISYIVVNVAC